TAASVVALALGIGGSSAIFSVLEGVVLRPIAAPEPNQLVRLYETVPVDAPNHDRNPYSTLDYLDVAKENGSFESVTAIQSTRLTMTVSSGPVQLPAAKDGQLLRHAQSASCLGARIRLRDGPRGRGAR